ncbi:MAG: PadR family transcriptional regulator [Ancrocorticia sp.]
MMHVILGLLMLWPQSLYELTKNFESGVSLFYSSSTGSIKRALDRLLADEYIHIESEGGPRGKKVYAITGTGRDEFHRWMLDDSPGGNLETSLLARSYFLGLVEPQERAQIAHHIRNHIRRELTQLEQLEAQAGSRAVPKGLEDVAQYQLATLQYGLVTLRAALSWADRHLPHQ